MKFDCSQIPANAVITNVDLKINVNNSTADTYEVFELKKAWTETGTTWNKYTATLPWTIAGARDATDRGSAILASFKGAAIGAKTITFTAAGNSLVSGWVNGTSANNGILLRSPLNEDDLGFDSREGTVDPVLHVVTNGGTYDLVPSADTRLEEKAPTTNYQTATTLWGGGNVNLLGYYAEAALKFDTSPIPQGETVSSATLKINVTNTTSNRYELFELKKAWSESTATWTIAATGTPWEIAGAKGLTDRGTTVLAENLVPLPSGQNSIDLNAQGIAVVQGWVNGSAANKGVLLRPPQSYDDLAFDSREVGIAPKLEVTYSTTTAELKVLSWNTHHGGIPSNGGSADPARLASYIAQMNPDIASLQEVDDTGQMDNIINALNSQTGITWNKSYSGLGNLVISRHAFTLTDKCAYGQTSGGTTVYTPVGGISINNRAIYVWSTHLSSVSAADRLNEAGAEKSCALTHGEARVIAGDFNMQYQSAEYNVMDNGYEDAWIQAVAIGAASNYPGNCDGCTKGSRIDYVFRSDGATTLELKSAAIVDTRDAQGNMPSDHKPLLVTYTVK